MLIGEGGQQGEAGGEQGSGGSVRACCARTPRRIRLPRARQVADGQAARRVPRGQQTGALARAVHVEWQQGRQAAGGARVRRRRDALRAPWRHGDAHRVHCMCRHVIVDALCVVRVPCVVLRGMRGGTGVASRHMCGGRIRFVRLVDVVCVCHLWLSQADLLANANAAPRPRAAAPAPAARRVTTTTTTTAMVATTMARRSTKRSTTAATAMNQTSSVTAGAPARVPLIVDTHDDRAVMTRMMKISVATMLTMMVMMVMMVMTTIAHQHDARVCASSSTRRQPRHPRSSGGGHRRADAHLLRQLRQRRVCSCRQRPALTLHRRSRKANTRYTRDYV